MAPPPEARVVATNDVTPKVRKAKFTPAEEKFAEFWDGIEEAAREEREAMAQWERDGKKGPMPLTPAIEQMMAPKKPRWGRE